MYTHVGRLLVSMLLLYSVNVSLYCYCYLSHCCSLLPVIGISELGSGIVAGNRWIDHYFSYYYPAPLLSSCFTSYIRTISS